MKMLDDNQTSFILTRNPKSQNQTKHIDVIYHHVRGLVEDGKLTINWIESSKMLADGLTKAFPTALFKRHQEKWGLVE